MVWEVVIGHAREPCGQMHAVSYVLDLTGSRGVGSVTPDAPWN